ncbi:hypothetical protein ACLB2K_042248 [Fragaria x ananassa]
MEVIPTRAALSRRLFIPDVRCIFCGNEVETGLHLFRDCPVVQSFWKHNPLHLRSYSYPGSTLAVWVFLVMDNLSMQQLEGFFMALWTVWIERNNMIWRGGSCNPSNMSVWAMQLLEEYKKVHTKPSVKMKRPRAKWCCPPSGRLKLNIDGAYLEDGRKGVIGVVVRNEYGNCVAALSRHVLYASSAMHMEAEALRASLLIAIHQGWDEVEIEGDCAIVMKALATTDGDVIEVSSILSDCRHYMETFRLILLRHIYREANGVAHRLAHLARSSSLYEFWVDETPDIIQDVLMEDGCNISRGLGNMSPSLYDLSLANNNMGDNT